MAVLGADERQPFRLMAQLQVSLSHCRVRSAAPRNRTWNLLIKSHDSELAEFAPVMLCVVVYGVTEQSMLFDGRVKSGLHGPPGTTAS
jgi:hypothetical protein